ncbi:Putative chromosome segregation DNA-binding protein [Candidatus Phycorickettsia trachydisci]|uniref:Probable chromosome-partitioning protein ParB n=1 Tax=Candidatus Phycorickettsia trachydisci TaxID=2115978 RepID=A0A2P1P9I6_9RICK|nr:ParB/RepB/Spo0J family partition protein [Candidatus Phycorickettsia trachydisci]AVP87931.1 Putative chromosome segregation DNA-binding protein [Candidatus Phycorickettsia trachydisci]
MTRKIRYKPLSKELENIVKPVSNSSTRASIGLEQAVGEYYFINTDQLHPFKNQARRNFNDDEISKLADSIREYGVRQPLSIIKNLEGNYEVVSGERRLRAAKQAGLTKVPCIILKENTDANAIALIENIHRKDLHPIELGVIYRKLIEEKIFENQERLAQAISVAKSTVSEYIKLSNIPEDIKLHLIEKNISSREKLRDISKAYEKGDIEKINSLVGVPNRKHKNFSILRIMSSEGEIKIQNVGLKNLSIEARKKVKNQLQKLIQQIDNLE